MNKKTILILMVAITAAVTYFLYEQPLPLEKRAVVEADLASQPDKYPATPVWWSDGGVLAIGMMPREASEKRNDSATEICGILWKHNVNKTVVEVYDILQIQKSDEWTLIGAADCRRAAP
ncbi:hypothetical protein [Amphritea japonica]|uniref:Uncharacterized protein n=1 Tax=Amphritea japonica ATCC BAA-1530 TaxID=1278309 RepID=A0A7R6SRU2_9GAMM|nr:hypothetical protein [Amphritea japonica]BBB25525.1 conserved hypothetical protein [Amphritea japonica ATCC BAA-1530]